MPDKEVKIVEAVPNFSEGRDISKIEKIIDSIKNIEGVKILDLNVDPQHNRSVITFTCGIERIIEAGLSMIKTAASLIDMEKHSGLHPRFGATDVFPIIPITASMDDCIIASRNLGRLVGSELNIPVYMYSESAMVPERRNLENIRNKNVQYEELKELIKTDKYRPDFGPDRLGSAGAVIIGARPALIAYNIYISTDDIKIGRRIASALRGRDGGLNTLKTLAFYIEARKMVQISMNITDYKKTSIYKIFELLSIECRRYNVYPVESELIGLMPMDALIDVFNYYMKSNITRDKILEYKIFT
ncbi:glutamate formimidoyltransferase [Picrophilus oshimae]|uniref:glutamate formimidoyltransferase n=1 Tax=Picrophilus torridus (strain ATCC 700027 / DSM 9790 / JCM 10055 / NBRC 100828 / KAW 2/3) TaxID=1122961 RepID=A0A8G2L7K8_PICTO|nr:glutamate formimidoyltransferase [Picrophilus oshimae]SMD31105.1 glutamate formiminotransferase [Picrophilus oshimae DSM 9789]